MKNVYLHSKKIVKVKNSMICCPVPSFQVNHQINTVFCRERVLLKPVGPASARQNRSTRQFPCCPNGSGEQHLIRKRLPVRQAQKQFPARQPRPSNPVRLRPDRGLIIRNPFMTGSELTRFRFTTHDYITIRSRAGLTVKHNTTAYCSWTGSEKSAETTF